MLYNSTYTRYVKQSQAWKGEWGSGAWGEEAGKALWLGAHRAAVLKYEKNVLDWLHNIMSILNTLKRNT